MTFLINKKIIHDNTQVFNFDSVWVLLGLFLSRIFGGGIKTCYQVDGFFMVKD